MRPGKNLALVAIAATAAIAAEGGTLASPAYAGWRPAVRIGAGGAPLLSFAPSGQAALAFQDKAGATYLVRRGPRGRFSGPVLVRAPSPLGPLLQGLVLPAGGDTALLFEDSGGGYDGLVQPVGSDAFGAPQQFDGSEGDLYSLPQATLLATAQGEVIAAFGLNDLSSFTTVLPAGGSAFGVEVGVPDGPNVLPSLAADDAGGTFEAAQGYVAYRPVGGDFAGRTVGFSDRYGNGSADDPSLAIAGGGNGYAAYAVVYGDRPGHVAIFVGRAGSFGRMHVLARTSSSASTTLVGPVVDRNGNVTVAWDECGTQGRGCSIAAARGSVHGRLGRAQTLATMSRTTKTGISAEVGDGIVALQRCRGSRCSISAALAVGKQGFGKPSQITADGQLVEVTGNCNLAQENAGTCPLAEGNAGSCGPTAGNLQDGNENGNGGAGSCILAGARKAIGDQLVVYTARNGSVWAAAQKPGSHSFGAPHRLSPPRAKVDDSTVTAAYGTHGEAIVAWKLYGGGLMAAVYQAPH